MVAGLQLLAKLRRLAHRVGVAKQTDLERRVQSADVPTAIVISDGDLVAQDSSGDPYSATAESWDTDLETTQRNFAALFLGVARAASANGQTDAIPVATAGEATFACAAATFKIGDLVGPAKHASEDELLAGTVAAVSEVREAIGRVARSYPSNTTSVVVEIFGGKLGASPSVRQSSLTSLTDNSGGTPGSTIAAISDANNPGSADLNQTQDAVASLTSKVNTLIARLEAAGVLAE